jgi:hypothetical protein
MCQELKQQETISIHNNPTQIVAIHLSMRGDYSSNEPGGKLCLDAYPAMLRFQLVASAL